MIKTITHYQSLTLSMIRFPKFQQTVEDNIHILYRNESAKRKNMFQGKNFFRGGIWIFFKFQGGIDQEVEGGLINIHFQRGIALYIGKKFFSGEEGQRSVVLYGYLSFISIALSKYVINFLSCRKCIQLLPIKNYVFVAESSRTFIIKTRLFPKPLLDIEMFLSM